MHALPRRTRLTGLAGWLVAGGLLLITFLTTTTLGAAWFLFTRTDVATDLVPWLLPSTVQRVWSDPRLLAVGLQFSLPTLVILLAHELGHWIACRRYRLPATPPFFLPAPFGLGTLGAFIRIRSPIRNKRQLFDVGVSGPLAGAVALLPFLLIGMARSRPAIVDSLPLDQSAVILVVPGQSLAIRLLVSLFHGPLPSNAVIDFHPWALAAWVGLLATALNLLPLGQLDGGHILYAATGRWQRRLAWPLWGALGVAGFFWSGWWLWWVVLAVIGLRHPPVVDEGSSLGAGRQLLALLAALLLILSFMPVPIRMIGIAEPLFPQVA